MTKFANQGMARREMAEGDDDMDRVSNADMADFWNGEGGANWVRFQEMMDASLLPFGRKAMAAAAIRPGEKVLDIGCGCGDTTLEIANIVGPQGRVLGVDISQSILARAKEKAIAGGQKNLAFEHGDAQVVALQPAAFDLVFSRFGVMFFDDPVAAFKNFSAALQPAGGIAFICWQPKQDNEWVTVPNEVVARHVPLPPPPAPGDPGPMSLGEPERVRRILTQAGFTNIQINAAETPFSVGNSRDEAIAFLMQMGPASTAINQAEADDTTKAKIAADLHEALSPYDGGQGVTLGTATWIVTADKG